MDASAICTVLVITYKHGEFLSKALDSIISQKTQFKYKIEIFDDASPDNTKEIIERYTKLYPDLIFSHISSQNLGAQNNFWRALCSVNTKYFIFLEGDDYWCNENKLELQINVMEKNPDCSFCGHNTYLLSLDEASREYKEGSLCCTQPFLKTKSKFKYEDFKSTTTGGYIPYVSARLIRTSAIDVTKIKYKESVLFDFTQFYYLLLQGNYYYIDIPMSVYQRTGSGICSGKTPTEFLNMFVQNAIDFNKQTNNIIADKIYSECYLQIDFRLKLYQANYVKRPLSLFTNPHSNGEFISHNVSTNILVQESDFSDEKYYFLCNGGLGHTALMCAFKECLEEKKQAPICYLIKKEQAFIAKLYHLTDYILVDTDGVDFEALNERFPNPEKGRIYVTHPFSHRECSAYYSPVYAFTSTDRYIPWLLTFLGLPEDTSVAFPVDIPELSSESQKKILSMGDLNKTILFLPESHTVPGISEYVWERKAKELKSNGFQVISCPMTPEYTIKGTKYVKLSAEEIMYVGMKCASIYSIRNGFCELLAARGKHLHIYYPSHSAHYIYSLNYPQKEFGADEIIDLRPSKRHSNISKNQNYTPMFLGVIRIPNRVYHFYNNHRSWFRNRKIINFLVKWM